MRQAVISSVLAIKITVFYWRLWNLVHAMFEELRYFIWLCQQGNELLTVATFYGATTHMAIFCLMSITFLFIFVRCHFCSLPPCHSSEDERYWEMIRWVFYCWSITGWFFYVDISKTEQMWQQINYNLHSSFLYMVRCNHRCSCHGDFYMFHYFGKDYESNDPLLKTSTKII